MSDEWSTLIKETEAQVDAERYVFDSCATRVDSNGPYHAQDVIAAIYSSKGSYAEMARLLARRRGSVRDYIYRHPDMLDYLVEVNDCILDRIEFNVLSDALEGNFGAAKFVLSTKGRDRGWTPRQEITGEDGGPIKTEETGARERIFGKLARIADNTAAQTEGDED